MNPTNPQPKITRFGPFEADLTTQELRKNGTKLRLPNQSFLVLSVLLERPGQLVNWNPVRSRALHHDIRPTLLVKPVPQSLQTRDSCVNAPRFTAGVLVGSPGHDAAH
jgi:hypothetical protein